MSRLQFIPPQRRVLYSFQISSEEERDLYVGGGYPHMIIAIDAEHRWRVHVSRKQFALDFRETPQSQWRQVRLWSKSRLKTSSEEEMMQKAQAALDQLLAQSSGSSTHSQAKSKPGGRRKKAEEQMPTNYLRPMQPDDLPTALDLLQRYPADHFPSQFPISASAPELAAWLNRNGWHGYLAIRHEQGEASAIGVIFWYRLGAHRISLACTGTREVNLLAGAIHVLVNHLLAYDDARDAGLTIEVVAPRHEAGLFLQAGFEYVGTVFDPKGGGPPWLLLEARKEEGNGSI